MKSLRKPLSPHMPKYGNVVDTKKLSRFGFLMVSLDVYILLGCQRLDHGLFPISWSRTAPPCQQECSNVVLSVLDESRKFIVSRCDHSLFARRLGEHVPLSLYSFAMLTHDLTI